MIKVRPLHPCQAVWAGAIALAFLVLAANESAAAYKITIGGIQVTYSKNGASARHDPEDNTLTIEIYEGNGNLKVTAGSSARGEWGQNYADILILSCETLSSISFTGRSEFRLFVAGEVALVNKVSLVYGTVGATDAYGSMGICSERVPISTTVISIKNG